MTLKTGHNLLKFLTSHPNLSKPQKLLNYTFKNDMILMEALTHTSFVHEFKSLNLKSNEKLEFLGDAILGLIVSHYLMDEFPDLKEGELSKFRSSLVNGQSFAELASFLGLGNCLLMGKGECKNQGHEKKALLADGFEALLGAIYREGGFDAAQDAFFSLLQSWKNENGESFIKLEKLSEFDAKSRLQEMTMALFKELPEYVSTQLEDQTFQVELKVLGKSLATLKDTSKKKAQRQLAQKAISENLIEKINKDNSEGNNVN
ncbi:MAG: ribonuclease III [Bacteriovoracaceae bacterium]|nr:ribonuclease III [Bacteriovoracaceae bacterium]